MLRGMSGWWEVRGRTPMEGGHRSREWLCRLHPNMTCFQPEFRCQTSGRRIVAAPRQSGCISQRREDACPFWGHDAENVSRSPRGKADRRVASPLSRCRSSFLVSTNAPDSKAERGCCDPDSIRSAFMVGSRNCVDCASGTCVVVCPAICRRHVRSRFRSRLCRAMERSTIGTFEATTTRGNAIHRPDNTCHQIAAQSRSDSSSNSRNRASSLT